MPGPGMYDDSSVALKGSSSCTVYSLQACCASVVVSQTHTAAFGPSAVRCMHQMGCAPCCQIVPGVPNVCPCHLLRAGKDDERRRQKKLATESHRLSAFLDQWLHKATVICLLAPQRFDATGNKCSWSSFARSWAQNGRSVLCEAIWNHETTSIPRPILHSITANSPRESGQVMSSLKPGNLPLPVNLNS